MNPTAGLQARGSPNGREKREERRAYFSTHHNGSGCFPDLCAEQDAGYQPLSAIAEVLKVFDGKKDDWGLAYWFISMATLERTLARPAHFHPGMCGDCGWGRDCRRNTWVNNRSLQTRAPVFVPSHITVPVRILVNPRNTRNGGNGLELVCVGNQATYRRL
ncbi:MAG: hypothetical protein ACI9OO_000085 [Bacteroidia bacterium]|jgi:hypothetical protein